MRKRFLSNGHRRPAGARRWQVAAVAGVSLATVSRVVNDDPKVAPDLAEKVQRRGRAARLPARRHGHHAAPRRPARRRASGWSSTMSPTRSTPPCTAGSRTSPARAACSPSRAAPTRTPSASASSAEAFLRAPRRRPDHRARRGRPRLSPARPRRRRRARVRRPPAGLHRRRRRAVRQRRRRRARPPRTCSPRPPPHRLPRRPARDLTAPSSACAATARRSPRQASPTTRRSCAWSSHDSATARRARRSCSPRPRPADRAVHRARTSSRSARCRACTTLGLQRAVALVGFDDLTLADVVQPGSPSSRRTRGIGRAAAELLFARLDGSTARRGASPADDADRARLGRG